MKRRIAAMILLLTLLLACGCTADETVPKMENSTSRDEAAKRILANAYPTVPALDEEAVILDGCAVQEYEKYSYNIDCSVLEELDEAGRSYCCNITATSRVSGGASGDVWNGYAVLTSVAAYASVMDTIEQRIEHCKSATGADDVVYFERAEAFEAPEWNAEFFEKYNLLMIDILRMYGIGAPTVKLRGGCAESVITVEVFYGGLSGTTADNGGAVLFIPIPKVCTEAAVEWYSVAQWNPYYGEDSGNN